MHKNFKLPFLHPELEQAVQDFIKVWNVDNTKDSGWAWTRPLANIEESATQFQIILAAPGLQKNDFKMTLDKDVLTISVDKEKVENGNKKVVTEFSYHKFNRNFRISPEVNQNSIAASYENGILTITLPKKEEVVRGPKTININ